MSLIGTKLMTWWKGEPVGNDRFGNRYYRERNGKRRWVLFRGEAEGSKVPPEWHAWLAHTVAEPPPETLVRQGWEKEHLPNLTGTDLAYRPPGSVSHGGHRPAATGDYEAWQPK